MRAAYAFAGWQWFDFVIIICINGATWRDLHAAHSSTVCVHKTCVYFMRFKNNNKIYIISRFLLRTRQTNNLQRFFHWFILSFGIRKNQQYARFMYFSAIYLQTKHYRCVFVIFHSALRSSFCQVREWAKKCTTTWKCCFFSNCMRCTIRYYCYYHRRFNFHLYVRVLALDQIK